jgi:hypothetical protein
VGGNGTNNNCTAASCFLCCTHPVRRTL